MAEINQHLQIAYYHFILEDPILSMNMEPEFFDAKTIQMAFDVAKKYVVKYHKAPTAEEMKELVRLYNREEQLTPDWIDALYAQKASLANYDKDWLYDAIEDWATIKAMERAIEAAAAYLKLNRDTAKEGNAKEIIEHIKAMFNQSCSIDFGSELDHGSDFWNAESHKQKRLVRRSTGFSFLDFCLNGGWFDGCLACFVGAPKIGKSLWMQNLCARSVLMGENSVYVSLELQEELVIARMGTNIFNIPSVQYTAEADDTIAFSEKIKSYRKGCFIQPGELLVKEFPTSTLSVIELETFLLKEEELRSRPGAPFKFKNVFVDYLNIMRNYRNPNTENTYMKIKQIAEDLRAMGGKNKWCIITATQTNRSQFDSNDISANQVSESSALGATVDVMWGIIADPLMMAQGKYYLKCLYDRVSPQQNKKKLYDCNFNYLRLTEDTTEGIIDAVDMYGNVQGNDKFIKGNPHKGGFNQTKQQFEPGSPVAEGIPENRVAPSPPAAPAVDVVSGYTQPVQQAPTYQQPVTQPAQPAYVAPQPAQPAAQPLQPLAAPGMVIGGPTQPVAVQPYQQFFMASQGPMIDTRYVGVM